MAHPDLNELLDALLQMAEMLLKEQGEFLPIGAVMLSDGEIRHVGGQIEGDDHPGSQALIDLLTENFRSWASDGKLRAAGICYDVLTTPPGKRQKQDAVCFGLEHWLGETADIFRPYTRNQDGEFRFEALFVAVRQPQFFLALPGG
jgi:hypothetical protein